MFTLRRYAAILINVKCFAKQRHHPDAARQIYLLPLIDSLKGHAKFSAKKLTFIARTENSTIQLTLRQFKSYKKLYGETNIERNFLR